MRIYIPTRDRVRQRTVERLSAKVHDTYKTTLVCSLADARKLGAYENKVDILVTKADGIAATRQFILDTAEKRGEIVVLMLDDDLPTWCQREPQPEDTGEDAKYHKATDKEVEAGLRDFAKVMGKYAHGSIGHRLFCQRHPELYYNARMLRALAYNLPMVREAGAKFRLQVMEDFDMQLQLLTKGYSNVVYNKLVQDQYGNNVDGGCAAYRTADVQAKAARDLAERWPDFVTVTTRAPKREWGGMAERTDVKVQFAKAFKSSQRGGE